MLAMLAKLHGTTIEEEIAKHNADIQRRVAKGDLHPVLSEDERREREAARKKRASDKEKSKRAALKALKPKPSAEEISAKALARAERKKANRRRYRVKARDALRALRAKTGRLRGGGPQKDVPVSKRRALTADERRARKAETDRRYMLAAQRALSAARATLEALRASDRL